MLDRRYTQEDDYSPVACCASSVEPMRRADYKAKKHPRPRNVDCRGRFALARRAKPGRLLASLEGGE